MSLLTLIALTKKAKEANANDVAARNEAFRRRMAIHDREFAEKIRASVPSATLLDKVCNWHALNDR